MGTAQKVNFSMIFFQIFSVIWLSYGFFLVLPVFRINYNNYTILRSYSLEGKQSAITGQDFYKFLKFADMLIPKGHDIKWLFPEGRFLGNDEYYFFRAYYYLFPRNYRDNADYILVFDRKEYKAPLDYSILAEYGPNKYILKRYR